MVLNHIAAIFFFSGPLFYIGLVMVVDPAGIAALPELFGHALRDLRRVVRRPRHEQVVQLEQPAVSRKARRALRLAGLALVVCGLLFAVVI
jgi:hypothetical protein